MDDEEELARLMLQLGLELPEVADEQDEDEPLSFDDLGDDGLERKPRDWRQEWERDWDDDTD